ncbi:MAG: AAA family ATPase [Myxococcales bacterium]|nr:AAA family ATPase [Myxococcales bacterium]
MKAFELAVAGKWGEISSIEALQGATALTLKSLHVYFPAHVLPVYSTTHLEHYLRIVAPEAPELDQGDALLMNRALDRALRAHAGLRDRTPYELGRFLYAWADPRAQKRVVKIAPGHDAEFWADCVREGYVCVGWGSMGDLRAYEGKRQFLARWHEVFAEKYPHKPKRTAKANEVWRLIELEPGDLVIANQGKSRVLAVGEVVDPGYEFRSERAKYPHTVKVKWDTSYAQDIKPVESWGMVTVAPVAPEVYREILERAGQPFVDGLSHDPKASIPVPVEPIFAEISEALERRGQVVLFGPPGTGKTYTARRYAVYRLLTQEGRGDAAAVLGDRARFLTEERRLATAPETTSAAQLTTLTFHPSYSYEDFVEGFRPYDDGTPGLALRLEAGVFKRVCRTALRQPGKTFVVMIDEFNRANVPKVLGELITLLERDKRGMQVCLPQSREQFEIPPNVMLIGTMNTADRSIKVLDAALRRRFAFIECMPDPDVLRGAVVSRVPLDELLDKLNERIRRRDGREKQIGHAFFLDGGRPVGSADELARRFRHEVLPLLQEYCHDDYRALADYLGEELVDVEDQALVAETLSKPEELLACLAKALLTDAEQVVG